MGVGAPAIRRRGTGGVVKGRAVIVCGSRDWTDYDTIWDALRRRCERHGEFTVIHGAARGADRLAGQAGRHQSLPVVEFPADWNKHGRAAGPIRNQAMLEAALDDYDLLGVLAFKEGFDHSLRRGGTEDMVRRAREAEVPTIVNPQPQLEG